jgi:hypothetical protein
VVFMIVPTILVGVPSGWRAIRGVCRAGPTDMPDVVAAEGGVAMETPGGRLKRPQDLPRNQLIPAADACAWCGAPYEVRLVRLPRGS